VGMTFIQDIVIPKGSVRLGPLDLLEAGSVLKVIARDVTQQLLEDSWVS
jgi:hypothetical protein